MNLNSLAALGMMYTVKQGDTADSIAHLLGENPANFKTNNLKNATITPGAKVFVPYAALHPSIKMRMINANVRPTHDLDVEPYLAAPVAVDPAHAQPVNWALWAGVALAAWIILK